MIVINATAKGESIYYITVGDDATYRVSAFSLDDALDLVADYLESHNYTNSYLDNLTIRLAGECSKWLTAEAFAKAHDLVCCGTNKIYIPVTNVKGCPNG